MHPTNGQKQLTPVAELGKSWKKLRRRKILYEDQQSQLIWTPRPLNTGPPNRQHTPADIRPLTHIQQRTSRSVYSEMKHLTLKRLEASGSLEVRWDGGWEHPHGDKVGWGGGVGCGGWMWGRGMEYGVQKINLK